MEGSAESSGQVSLLGQQGRSRAASVDGESKHDKMMRRLQVRPPVPVAANDASPFLMLEQRCLSLRCPFCFDRTRTRC